MDALLTPPPAYRNLRVYRRAGALADELFWITRHFPSEEHHALTEQLRQTARSVSASVVESWNHRYNVHAFRAHIAEALSACACLTLWLNRAYECRYLTKDQYRQLLERKAELQRMLHRLHGHRIALLA